MIFLSPSFLAQTVNNSNSHFPITLVKIIGRIFKGYLHVNLHWTLTICLGIMQMLYVCYFNLYSHLHRIGSILSSSIFTNLETGLHNFRDKPKVSSYQVGAEDQTYTVWLLGMYTRDVPTFSISSLWFTLWYPTVHWVFKKKMG